MLALEQPCSRPEFRMEEFEEDVEPAAMWLNSLGYGIL